MEPSDCFSYESLSGSLGHQDVDVRNLRSLHPLAPWVSHLCDDTCFIRKGNRDREPINPFELSHMGKSEKTKSTGRSVKIINSDSRTVWFCRQIRTRLSFHLGLLQRSWRNQNDLRACSSPHPSPNPIRCPIKYPYAAPLVWDIEPWWPDWPVAKFYIHVTSSMGIINVSHANHRA